jgi:hypothetical protein
MLILKTFEVKILFWAKAHRRPATTTLSRNRTPDWSGIGRTNS